MVSSFPLRQRLSLHLGSCLHLAAKGFVSLIALSAVVTVLATSVTGCDTAVAKPRTDAPAPDDMTEPTPTLLGTWERTTVGTDDDGTVETEKQTVTITDTHFMERNVVLDANGVEIDSWEVVGTVDISTSTVILTRFEHDGKTAPVAKDYVIVDGALFIHHWGSNHLEANFDRFTRVGDPPMPGAAPLPLQGTWRVEYRDTHEEHGDIVESKALTLTSTRAIDTSTIYDASGDLVDYWTDATGWSMSGTTITKTFRDDDGAMQSVDKEFVIVGDFLAVHDWWDEEPTQSFQFLERIHDPLPGGLAGTWNGWCADDFPICGRELQPWTFTFGDSFSEEYQSPPSLEPSIFRVTGSMQDDPGNYFVHVTWDDATVTVNGSPDPDFHASKHVGHQGRYAYAPTGIPGQLVFSTFGRERTYDEETLTWKENEDNPYGNYWMRLERQTQ